MRRRPFWACPRGRRDGSGCLPGPGSAAKCRRTPSANSESSRFFAKSWPLLRPHVALFFEQQPDKGFACRGVAAMTEPSLPEESILLQALEIASAAGRAAFLDCACG